MLLLLSLYSLLSLQDRNGDDDDNDDETGKCYLLMFIFFVIPGHEFI